MPITRRAVLATAPLAATSMLGGSVVAQGQTAPQGNTRQAPGFYRYKIGDIEVDGDQRRLRHASRSTASSRTPS